MKAGTRKEVMDVVIVETLTVVGTVIVIVERRTEMEDVRRER